MLEEIKSIFVVKSKKINVQVKLQGGEGLRVRISFFALKSFVHIFDHLLKLF